MWNQIFLALFGASAIYLVGRTDKWKRYGYVMGLLGQPFWFYSAIEANQWGITILCCFYLYAWSTGFYNHWIKKDHETS